jgi:hypothetical protein
MIVIRQFHLLFFDSAHQAFGVPILPRGPDFTPTKSTCVPGCAPGANRELGYVNGRISSVKEGG